MSTYWQAIMRYYDRRGRVLGKDRLVYAWLRPEASEDEVRGVQSRAIWIDAPQGAEGATRINEIWDERP